MNNVISQRPGVFIVAAIAIFSIVQLTGVPSSEAEDWFSISASTDFIPQAAVKTTDAGFSTSEFEIELSAFIVDVGYTLTMFSWDKGETLPFGNGRKSPWQELHKISVSAKHQGKLSDRWAYLFDSKGSAAFEDQIDSAYLKGRLHGGFRYTLLDDKLYLLAGGGLTSDDFETGVTPAGGFQWEIGYGFSFSFIYPIEADLSYESPDEQLSATVNVLSGHSNIAYKFSPAFEIELSYNSGGISQYRLSDDSLVEPLNTKKYVDTHSEMVSLELSYSPFEHLACDIGGYYQFSRTLEILDEHEETLEKFELDNAVGGTLALTYTF